MTREELDFIGSMNMCDEISNEAYKKIVCHCEEQEPCEDAISRQAAINESWTLEYPDGSLEMVIRADDIMDLPSVKPISRWIPVTERFPEEGHEILVTIKSCGEWYVCHSVFREGMFWQKNFEYNHYKNPLAWMPLPKPYTGADMLEDSDV